MALEKLSRAQLIERLAADRAEFELDHEGQQLESIRDFVVTRFIKLCDQGRYAAVKGTRARYMDKSQYVKAVEAILPRVRATAKLAREQEVT